MSSLSEEKLRSLKENVLVDKMSWLCEEIGDPGRYFPELRSKRVLNVTDTQLVKSKPTDREKIEEFVTLISKRSGDHGQHGLDIFIEALKKQRVHAHVARILVRALNKKKAEAERTSTPLSSSGHSQATVTSPAIAVERAAVGNQYRYHNSVHTSPSNGSDNSTSSSRYDVHPDHGPLPPNPPPTSMSSGASQPGTDDGNTHPQFGCRPPPPPPLSTGNSLMSPEEEGVSSVPPVNGRHSGYVEDTHSHCSDELGPQTMPPGATSISTNGSSFSSNDFVGGAAPPSYSSVTSSRDSYPSIHSNEPLSAEVERLRKTLDQLKYDKKRLELDHDDALRKIHFLQTENQQLKDQLALHRIDRPSRLAIASPHHAHPYPSFPPGDFHAHRNYNYRARNSSPSPGLIERDGPVLRAANSSGSLNSHGSRGSYNASESQV